jgi:curved DNA-binding protein
MKYKDYYSILGVPRDASEKDIKNAYRKLARKYHPDVSKEKGAEERFKDVAEAYKTLKDAQTRAAYDQLGQHRPGEEFRPGRDWAEHFGGAAEFARGHGFEDLDLADLFEILSGHRRPSARRGGRGGGAMPGQDYDVVARIRLEDAYNGALVDLNLSLSEYDAEGRPQRVDRTIKARIPKGATAGQRLRLPGQGGKGYNGGRDGDLYLHIELHPHDLYRVDGHDLYLDLPLAPWEAALGATVEVPTLGGAVRLKVPAGSQAGQRLRLAKNGLPLPRGGAGDLYAVVQIVVPPKPSDQERALFEQLAQVSAFNPRTRFRTGGAR